MSNPVSVSEFCTKSHDNPDEVRQPPKTRLEVVNLPGFTVGRMTLSPGWRWSECVKPVAKTDRCQLSHVGYCVSGAIMVQLPDGSEKPVMAGQSYTIPPGHDAWVCSDGDFVALEVLSAAEFAKPA